jgi:acetylglutamate kinase
MAKETEFQKNVKQTISDLGINITKYWLNLFETLPPYQIGVIKASGKLLEGENLEQLCTEFNYMSNIGLHLPLIIGGGVQYDNLPDYKKAIKVNGLRVTSKELMKKIALLASENQKKVLEHLENVGTPAEIINPNNVIVEPHGIEIDSEGKMIDTCYVGDVLSINTKQTIQAILNSKIPIISHIGMYNNEPYNINATTLAKEVVKYLGAKKLIMIGDKPILDQNNQIIKSIQSEAEFKSLVKHKIITGGMITNGEDAYDLLKYLGPGHSVQITALKSDTAGHLKSTGLLEEILGNGSGTKIILPHNISSYPLEAIEIHELSEILNDIFSEKNEKLVPNYFDMLKQKNPTIYLDPAKQGGAITYQINDFEYICKLFTHKDYEGLGIAKSTIDSIVMQKKAVVWRTSIKKSCNIGKYDSILNHYKDACKVITNDYAIFMIGIPEYKKKEVCEQVISIPRTLEPIKT